MRAEFDKYDVDGDGVLGIDEVKQVRVCGKRRGQRLPCCNRLTNRSRLLAASGLQLAAEKSDNSPIAAALTPLQRQLPDATLPVAHC